MRNYKIIISSFIAGVGLLISGCGDEMLDISPQNIYTEEAVFEDVPFSRGFLNEIYTAVPSGYDRGGWLLDASTDIGNCHFPEAGARMFTQASLSPTSLPVFYGNWWDGNVPTIWQKNYQYIYRANYFLANIDNVTPKNDQEAAEKIRLKGEAYFLRGLFYHELYRWYGGVVLLAKPQSVDDPDLFVPRSSDVETTDFIAATLDSAAELLPEKRTGSELGRATKAAALALKGRQLLFAGQWEEAAEASQQVMSMGYSLFPSYEELFWTKNNNNNEILFAKQYTSVKDTRNHQLFQYHAPPWVGGWGGTQPTQEIVDMYEMSDGSSFDWNNPEHSANPYANRDPRFYATVIYDQAEFTGKVVDLRAESMYGIRGSNNDRTRTGYYLKKFMDPAKFNDGLGLWYGYNNWNEIRYAEVLLNYAEAKNEAEGPDASVYQAINDVRSRVNMPAIPAGLSKEQMRERIRHERTIEFAFEEHYFFDVRRWNSEGGQSLADQVLSKPVSGIDVSMDRTSIQPIENVATRTWNPRMRLLPIAQSEYAKYPAGVLTQNPGY